MSSLNKNFDGQLYCIIKRKRKGKDLKLFEKLFVLSQIFYCIFPRFLLFSLLSRTCRVKTGVVNVSLASLELQQEPNFWKLLK